MSLSGGALFAVSSYDGFSFSAPFIAIGALAIFCWLATYAERPQRALYSFGIAFYAAAFYWIPDTLKLFSGFPVAVCYGLFGLFALAAAFQFYLAGVVQEFLRKRTVEPALWGLLLPLSWAGINQVFPRMFPWEFVHPFIGWSALSGLAEFLGVQVLTFLLLWFVNLVVLVFTARGDARASKIRLSAAALLLLPLIGGAVRTTEIHDALSATSSLKLAVIQPNFDAFAFMDREELPRHTERILEMSQEAVDGGAQLLIWPESSINRAIPEQVKTFQDTSMQYLGMIGAPAITGALGVRKDDSGDGGLRKFNAGLVIGNKGEILGRYYKRILMPFGEYMPGATIFPTLKDLSPQTGDFDVGDIEQPVSLQIGDRELRVGILICYEDIVSQLSRDYLLRGADLLVNLTNDIWYGDSAALSQHNLLAAWRAIEVRTFLVRGTNSGFSSVIDPLGQIVATGPINSEQTIFAEVKPGHFSQPMFASIALSLEWCLTICFWGGVLWAQIGRRLRRKGS